MERVVTFTEDPEQTGLTMRLYEGAAQDAGTDAAPRGAATPLSAADAQALVARLPALDGADAVRRIHVAEALSLKRQWAGVEQGGFAKVS